MNNKLSNDNLSYSNFTHIKQGVTVNLHGSGSVKLSGLSVQFSFSSGQIRNPQSVSKLTLEESHEFDKLLVLILAFFVCILIYSR